MMKSKNIVVKILKLLPFLLKIFVFKRKNNGCKILHTITLNFLINLLKKYSVDKNLFFLIIKI